MKILAFCNLGADWGLGKASSVSLAFRSELLKENKKQRQMYYHTKLTAYAVSNSNAHYCTVCSPQTWRKMHCCENSSALFRKHRQPWQSTMQARRVRENLERAQGEQIEPHVRLSFSSRIIQDRKSLVDSGELCCLFLCPQRQQLLKAKTADGMKSRNPWIRCGLS